MFDADCSATWCMHTVFSSNVVFSFPEVKTFNCFGTQITIALVFYSSIGIYEDATQQHKLMLMG